MKLAAWSLLALLPALAAPAFARDKGPNTRKPSSADECVTAAGLHAESYLKDKLTGGGEDLRHELYKKFPGKNGYGEIVYTYMYKLTGESGSDAGILRVTENHKCEYTSIGRYKDEEGMNADDAEAAEDGAEEGQ